MNGHLVGAFFLLAGSLTGWCICCRDARREVQWIEDLSAALSAVETAIRWQKQPLPRAIRQQQTRKLCGHCFRRTADLLEGEIPLQEAWIQAFSDGSLPPDVTAAVLRLEWSGDEQQLTGAIRQTIRRLEHLSRQRTEARREKERLRLALALTGAGLAVIILI